MKMSFRFFFEQKHIWILLDQLVSEGFNYIIQIRKYFVNNNYATHYNIQKIHCNSPFACLTDPSIIII